MTRRWASRLLTAVLLLLLGAGALLLRPTWAGGDTANLLVSGHSMDGTYRSGDLVFVKRRASYGVGDIVGFQVPAGEAGAGMVVIHRIVGTADGGYVTQGDDNPEPDPWVIGAADVWGRAALRVPAGGTATAVLRSQLGVSIAFGVLSAWAAFGMLGDGDGVSPASRLAGHRRQPPAAT